MRVNVVEVIRAAGGAERWKELREAGVTERELVAAVNRGWVIRYHRGCYCLPKTPGPVRAAVLFRGQVGCVSALHLAGIPLLVTPKKPHIIVPSNRSLARVGTRPVDRAVIHCLERGHDLVSAVDVALDDAADCLDPLSHLCAVDGALHRGFVVHEQFEQMWARHPVRGAWLRKYLRSNTESPAESLARHAIERAGYRTESQARVDDTGRRDLLVEGVLVVEVDGYGTHGNRKAFAEDRALDRHFLITGQDEMRFAASEVFRDPEVVARDVGAYFARSSARKR